MTPRSDPPLGGSARAKDSNATPHRPSPTGPGQAARYPRIPLLGQHVLSTKPPTHPHRRASRERGREGERERLRGGASFPVPCLSAMMPGKPWPHPSCVARDGHREARGGGGRPAPVQGTIVRRGHHRSPKATSSDRVPGTSPCPGEHRCAPNGRGGSSAVCPLSVCPLYREAIISP